MESKRTKITTKSVCSVLTAACSRNICKTDCFSLHFPQMSFPLSPIPLQDTKDVLNNISDLCKSSIYCRKWVTSDLKKGFLNTKSCANKVNITAAKAMVKGIKDKKNYVDKKIMYLNQIHSLSFLL